ncbi:DUF4238 domain-containing protein [Methylobacterium sp. E-066]|uniref:DUF4238 domain-containing protein n=1 Tax=Methylobacterium sp. E-066 TaxID=2836584 RepID=UPI001FBBAB73|nr:DUF4238 domain-containing protein [Methylobacterium sp. E-066]MCJ2139423.1 DUF4238 domain-containing protein [Methylobacterium sp. E-066]
MSGAPGGFPAGQHFIPEMLQKRFVDHRGMLWVHDRRRPERGFFRSTPKGIFKERHLYTVAGPDGSPSALVERTLGHVENAAGPVLDRVVEHVRAGGRWDLTSEERVLLLFFLYVQLKGCPEFFRGIPLDESMETFAEGLIAAWEDANGPMPPEDRERHLSADNLEDLQHSARMKSLMTLSPRVLEALYTRGLTVIHIPRPDRQFALASLPVVRLKSPSGRMDLGDPEVELSLPIAPDVAIASYGMADLNQIVHITHDTSIRRVNWELARSSNTIASSSRELLRSLTRRLPPPV